jgi:nucleoid-associated protein YgaU
MGNFEKLIVLVVLFSAAVVLALNFTGGDEARASDPLAGADEVLDEAGLEEEPLPEPEIRSGLIHAGPEAATDTFVEPEPPRAELAAGLQPASPAAGLTAGDASDPTGRILLDTSGLRPSFLDEYMVYVVAAGDTWPGLAQRFFQDGRFTRNLMQANEGLAELEPGKEILVPVYDVIAADASRSASVATPETEEEPALFASGPLADDGSSRLDASSATSPKPKAATAKPAGEYVVQPGDTLSDIALAAFGSASRWKELLAANEDKLAKPEYLRAGMKLTIPAGGKVPSATVARTEKAPEAKKASSSTTTTKKKKVL